MRGEWVSEKHSNKNQEEPTDHPLYQQSWQLKTYVKETIDDASEDVREKKNLG